MENLINYRTPANFDAQFQESYVLENLKNIRILGTLFFIVALSVRLVAVFFNQEMANFMNFEVYSLINYIQLGSTLIFSAGAHLLLKYSNSPVILKKAWTLMFAIFLILITMVVSYNISLFNTKNTVTLFMLGIFTVSLFLSFKLAEILFITSITILVYWGLIWYGPIDLNQKIMNIFAGIIFSTILFVFSRYCYYFKSQQFVRVKLLQIKNSEIESLHQQQGEILSFVAHDLRAPIANIEALTGMIKNDMPANFEQKEEIENILKSTLLAKSIINDLIEVIKTKPGELERHQLDLQVFLTRFINKWINLSKRKINLEGIHDPTFLLANENKLERVLDNLISNAIKFSEENQDITIKCEYGKNSIKIQIIDQGIGIPTALLAQIFTQFTPAGRIGLKGEKSIGLGLHIAKRIVEQHYGELSVESEENKGTTFTMLLPI